MVTAPSAGRAVRACGGYDRPVPALLDRATEMRASPLVRLAVDRAGRRRDRIVFCVAARR